MTEKVAHAKAYLDQALSLGAIDRIEGDEAQRGGFVEVHRAAMRAHLHQARRHDELRGRVSTLATDKHSSEVCKAHGQTEVHSAAEESAGATGAGVASGGRIAYLGVRGRDHEGAVVAERNGAGHGARVGQALGHRARNRDRDATCGRRGDGALQRREGDAAAREAARRDLIGQARRARRHRESNELFRTFLQAFYTHQDRARE